MTYDPNKTSILFDDIGITVGQLREWLRLFPDDGEIWIMTSDGLSCVVKECIPLNKREETCDVILEADTEVYK